MRPEDRERATIEAATRVVDRVVARAKSSDDLEAVLSDTLYNERRRLEREPAGRARTRSDQAFYQDLQRRLRHASKEDLRRLLDDVSRRFAREIVGSFDDRVYRLSTTVVPTGLSVLLGAMTPKKLRSLSGLRRGLSNHLQIQGALDHVRKLEKLGTVIVVPTHASHLDSLVIGYAIHLIGLPPLLYGAGLNLFENPLMSFFMNNLGAYRVDRKKHSGLYKDVLKEYATVALEYGYDNLFFPGGTRSRSGAVERHLKRGLLGTGIAAFVNNLRSARKQPQLFVLPCTISYKLVLEAETLIEDHLKEVGKSRYIIEDDEFSHPRRILRFFTDLASLDAKVLVNFSEPLDLFGNPVDEEGRSLDPRGRAIDPKSYVLIGGEPRHDRQRDEQYTNELAQAVAASFMKDNVLMSTHLVGLGMMQLLRRHNPDVDEYRLLRTGGAQPSFPATEVAEEVGRILSRIEELAEPPRLAPELQGDLNTILEDALAAFACYHAVPAAVRRGDRVFHEDRSLLLYYSNRLRGYDLGRRLAN